MTTPPASTAKKGFPGVSPRVVLLWAALTLAIAGLVVVADYFSPRNRRWPATAASHPAATAPAQPASAASTATTPAASAAAPK